MIGVVVAGIGVVVDDDDDDDDDVGGKCLRRIWIS